MGCGICGRFFKNMFVRKKGEIEYRSVYFFMFIFNRKIKYEEKYFFWIKLC